MPLRIYTVNQKYVKNKHGDIGVYKKKIKKWIKSNKPYKPQKRGFEKQSLHSSRFGFLDSDKLGQEYQDDIFVASAKKGTIFHFDLNEDRKSLSLAGDLADLVLSKKDESGKIIFAIWLFFKLGTNNTIDDTDRYLAEGCYSLNSKWICPNP